MKTQESQVGLSKAQRRLTVVLCLAAVLPCVVAFVFSQAVQVQWAFDSIEALNSAIHRSQMQTCLALLRYMDERDDAHWSTYVEERDRMNPLVSAVDSLQHGASGGKKLQNATSQLPAHEIESLDSEYARLKSLPSHGDSMAAIDRTVEQCRHIQEIAQSVRRESTPATREEGFFDAEREELLHLLEQVDATDEQMSAALYSASKHLQSALLVRMMSAAGGVSILLLAISFTAMRGVRRADTRALAHLAQLEAVARNSPDAIVLRDSSSRYVFVNHVASQRLRIRSDQAIGQNPMDLLGEKNGAMVYNADLRVLGTKAPFEFDMVMSIEGEERILETRHSPVFGTGGSVVAIASIERDVTGQRKQEKHLRTLASALANVGDSIFISDANFDPGPTIVYANKAFLKLVEMDESEVIGKDHRSVFMPRGQRGAADRILGSLHDRGEYQGEIVVQLRSGKRLHLDIHVVPVFDEHGRPTNFVSVQRDITRKKMEEHNQRRLLQMLMNAQREERRRISVRLHDHAGQMLTSMLLRLAAVQNATQEEAVKAAIADISGVASLTLEDISRLARGLYPAILDDLGLVEAVRRSLQDFEAAGVNAELVVLGFDEQRLPARLEGELYQIIQEALSNVRKHSRAKSLKVLLERRSAIVTARISDDGIGFETNMLEKRLTSLGLIGIKERVSLLGGSMSLHSQTSGGTRLEVDLPVLEPTKMVEVADDNA